MWREGESGNIATQFKQGLSGNPNGRPRGHSLREVILRWLLMEHGTLTLPNGEKVHLTKQDEMIRQQILKSIEERDTLATKAVLEFAHGKAIQFIQQENKDVKDFSSVEEELNFIRSEEQRLYDEGIELLNKTDGVVNSAVKIVTENGE